MIGLSKKLHFWLNVASKCATIRRGHNTIASQIALQESRRRLLLTGVAASCGIFVTWTYVNNNLLHAKDQQQDTKKSTIILEKPPREKLHFDKYASVDINGEMYMTPKDFLDCIIQDSPRPRIKRKKPSSDQVNQMMRLVPQLKAGVISEKPSLLRQLDDNGLISFVEYLFLLSLLTRSQSGFRVAFDLIDISDEGTIVKNEFFQFCQLGLSKKRDVSHTSTESNPTTLYVHFFGPTGDKPLTFGQFSTFLASFQREVLQAEFNEYSRGLDKVTEKDFAQILMRYADLHEAEKEAFVDRMLDKLPPQEQRQGITFQEFELFTNLLNNLNDFAIAIRFYSVAGRSLSREEFRRAAKICLNGQELPQHLINTVFCLFDAAGDGQLSYDEFIAVMKNRLSRRVRSALYKKGWSAFQSCVKETMRESNRFKSEM